MKTGGFGGNAGTDGFDHLTGDPIHNKILAFGQEI